MNLGHRINLAVSNFIDPNQAIRNKFNEAFLYSIGGGNYTQYDTSNTTYIDKGYNINPIVYSVITQQSRKTASVPYYVKKIEDKEANRKLTMLDMATKGNLNVQQFIKSVKLETKAYAQEDMPFPMEKPNPNQTWSEMWSLYKTFLKATGNAYFYMVSPEDGPNKGTPKAIYLLPSQYTQIVLKPNTDLMVDVDPIDYFIMVYARNYIKFDAENVIHIKYPNPNYGDNGEHLYGMSPLRAALKNIESSNSSLNLNIKTLKSGGAFGLIHAKGQNAMTPEQAAGLKEKLLEMDSSPERLSKITGVSAEIGFTRLSLTSDELKPFDYLRFDQKQICNTLGWSDKLLNNDEGAKYDNVNQYRKQVVTDDIKPDLTLAEEAFNARFLPRFKGYENTCLKFDVQELPEMQSDVKEMTEWLNNALDRGVINRNEYRQAINYLKLDNEDLEIMTVQTDIISLNEALNNDFNVL